MGRKKNESTQAASDAHQVNPDNRAGEVRPDRYVVVREGHRVSPSEYDSPEDPKALEEVKFWRGIAKKHSWGEPVAVVKYDNKLHRVW